jgi:hypothetical protein
LYLFRNYIVLPSSFFKLFGCKFKCHFLASIFPFWANIWFYSILNFCSVYYRRVSSLMRGWDCVYQVREFLLVIKYICTSRNGIQIDVGTQNAEYSRTWRSLLLESCNSYVGNLNGPNRASRYRSSVENLSVLPSFISAGKLLVDLSKCIIASPYVHLFHPLCTKWYAIEKDLRR